ncbi:uncharacterized protein Z518_02200 [Rhinocladiella mackenziei CBS 650.93]|uniref:Autophagy-related protein 28 n=1 Tax=Rhinocladiella mackenziei CBS 650.93 TaxID=1442369 RepID=A0A0D2FZ62_9EURO|nr:uncharacterized protein Z518_02200 [Rhinocladiella mackenziei CBS 650.93]KIX07547.1 hypothetical protein Z518_02200 [Rhinocladiella mackenziei CBS 650.93]
MKKSFIERIFPHPSGSLPQYEPESAAPSRSPRSPPRIVLKDSVASPSGSRNASTSPRHFTPSLSSPLVRYDDPFLQVERAAKSLERTFQSLLDAQSEGLIEGIGAEPNNDASSAGSPTPTPSVSTPPRREKEPRAVPVRQPQTKKISLRGARQRIAKSMRELAAVKDWELRLIDKEVVARHNALKHASDLESRRKLLQDEIEKIQAETGATSLRSEVQQVEHDIRELENTLFELRARHRQLQNQVRELESSKDSKLSSFKESFILNENQVKRFLRQPPVPQSLSTARDPGMYALKPERRSLQGAQDQWTSEIEMLNLRKSDVENEKQALEVGSKLWREAVHRIREFEKELRTQTNNLSQPQLHSTTGGGDTFATGQSTTAAAAGDTSLQVVLNKLSSLITSLQQDLAYAESKNWNLLICSIGAELAAFEQARDLLQETANWPHGTSVHGGNEQNLVDEDDQITPYEDLLSGGVIQTNGAGSRSPGESSNHSLEDTLREFEKRKEQSSGAVYESSRPGATDFLDDGFGPSTVPGPVSASTNPPDPTSESEDDDPGPDFLLSHT